MQIPHVNKANGGTVNLIYLLILRCRNVMSILNRIPDIDPSLISVTNTGAVRDQPHDVTHKQAHNLARDLQ